MNPIYPLKRPRTLTEQAVDVIRARIVSGDFGLGEALSEITLAAELGVSKTPVREAFLQLKNEGLVEIQPQRGTFVFQMTSQQVCQLTVLRELLEVSALHIAIATNPQALAGALQDVVDAMVAAAGRVDVRAYLERDYEFHQRIIVASENEFIEAAYANIAFRIHALRNRLSLEAQQSHRSLDEHIALTQRVGAGDADAAAVMLLEHIRATTREYMEGGGEQKRRGTHVTRAASISGPR